jgi:zinc protease
VIPRDGLPLVDGTLLFPGGRTDEETDLAGVTELLAEVLREGGSERTPGGDLDGWLDGHAASIACIATPEALRMDFSCVSQDLGNVLVLIGELLRQPAYPEAVLERARARLSTRLARRAEDPARLADLVLDRVTAGEGSLLARRPTPESVARVTRLDLLRHHRRLIGPSRLVIGVTGDAEPATLAAQLETQLRGLAPAAPLTRREPQVLRRPSTTTIHVVDRPGLAQCELRLATPGTRRLHRDAAALRLWSEAVGAEGAANRMMVRLRAERGLVYGGRLAHEPGWDRAGRVLGACSTRVEAVGDTVSAWFEVLRESLAPLPAEELEAVRRRLLNAGVFEIDSPDEVLRHALDLEFHGYPQDHAAREAERLRALGPDEVAEAVQRHVDPSRLTLVVVGPADALVRRLEPYGRVVVVEARGGPETGGR